MARTQTRVFQLIGKRHGRGSTHGVSGGGFDNIVKPGVKRNVTPHFDVFLDK